MREVLALSFLTFLPPPANHPPPKEWQPTVDAAINAIRKKDAAALEKMLMSLVELNALCPGGTAISQKDAEEFDKGRPRAAASAIEDCNIMSWKTAKFVSVSGGEPEPPGKCDKVKRAKPVTLVYQDTDLGWTITLQPIMFNGKRLLSLAPRCNATMNK